MLCNIHYPLFNILAEFDILVVSITLCGNWSTIWLLNETCSFMFYLVGFRLSSTYINDFVTLLLCFIKASNGAFWCHSFMTFSITIMICSHFTPLTSLRTISVLATLIFWMLILWSASMHPTFFARHLHLPLLSNNLLKEPIWEKHYNEISFAPFMSPVMYHFH